MIIGKDRERVRMLEAATVLSLELIDQLKKDLEEIAEALKSEDPSKTVNNPYYKIYVDIGRCQGYMDFFNG